MEVPKDTVSITAELNGICYEAEQAYMTIHYLTKKEKTFKRGKYVF